MDYYEELGLSRTASAEEIRHAYKSLARLLHPDQQQDPELRRLAECQMKRLNAVTAILTHPTERRRYDRKLSLPPAEEESVPERPLRMLLSSLAFNQRWVWLAAAVIGATGLLSYFSSSPGPRAEVVRARLVTATDAPPRAAVAESSPVRVGRRRRVPNARRVEPEPVAARREGNPTLPAPVTPSAAVVTPDGAAALSSRPQGVRPSSPPPSSGPPTRGLAGTWFYTPPKMAPPTEALYPPEFIEMVVLTDGGMLSGRYRARYKVSDRAISPEVLFQFRGRASGDQADLEWTAGGGARGGVGLRLLSEDQLEVTWSATTLGTSLGLASGTAVLMRRHEF